MDATTYSPQCAWLTHIWRRISTYLDATPSCKVHYLTKATAAVYDSETKVWCVSCTSPTSGVFSVYSRSITAATGGCQVIPSNIAFKKGSKGEDRMITSDFALTEAGMEHIKDMLGNPRVNAAPNRSRIAVIGGSHSAFSVLWTLLTKCTVQNENMAADSDAKGDGAGLPATPLPYPFTPQGILLLHRSPVTVFYNTTAQADKDSYVYSKTKVNSAGQVNVFGGLRGDAKALYRRLVEGKETKVKMYLAGATSGGKAVVRKACEEADCVIFCGGYQTNTIEKGMHVVDKDGKKEVRMEGSWERRRWGGNACEHRRPLCELRRPLCELRLPLCSRRVFGRFWAMGRERAILDKHTPLAKSALQATPHDLVPTCV